MLVNPLTTDDASWRRQFFGRMLSVGAIHFEDRFCASRKGEVADSAWRRLKLPTEKPWSMPGGPFVCLLAQMGVENAPFTL